MSAAVDIAGLCVNHGDVPALIDVSFSLPEGERAVLLGPNGAGKTTLLRTLTGLHRPAAGSIRLFGRLARDISPPERAALMAVVPQELFAPMPFTVGEIVLMGRTASLPRWRHPGAEDHRAAERAMAFMDVLELQHRTFDTLSGGERQRAAVAMALAREPRLLLLDEPTSHLDVHHRFEILRLLDRLHHERGVTVLMSSHDLDLAARYGGRILLLDQGRLVASGSPREVLREDRLQSVYRCDLRVEVDAAGIPLVRPPPAVPKTAGCPGAPLFVIAGGGSGIDVLRTLVLAGVPVRCGVLNEGDSDARTASALGVDCILERPFSALGESALNRARAWIRASSAVVVCETAFGTGNVENLDLALEARRAGIPVWLHAGDPSARDFTPDHAACQKMAALRTRGVHSWRRSDEVLAAISGGGPAGPAR